MNRRDEHKDMERCIREAVARIGVRRGSVVYEDCVQEAWVAVLLLDARRKHSDAYIRQAARWAALRFLNRERAEARKIAPADPAPGNNPEEEVIMNMQKEQGLKAMAGALSMSESFVYLLTAYSPLSQKQIGDAMGLTARHVRRLLSSARRKVAALDAARSGLASAGCVLD